MDRREAYERRVWRLAYLLTGGREELCPRIIGAALDAQPDLRRLDPAHLDRLVVLSARRLVAAGKLPRPSIPQAPDPGHLLLAAAAALPRQQHETWALARVDGLDMMGIAKAMDCSKTASQRHLEQADETLKAAFGDRLPGMLKALQALADRQAPGPSLARYRAAMRRRKRIRLALITLTLVAVALAGAFVVLSFR